MANKIIKSNDSVNHPVHYADTCSIECIDAMTMVLGYEGMVNFCIGNAFKYVWRCKNKNNMEEDLNKARWYIDKANDCIRDLEKHSDYLAVAYYDKIEHLETIVENLWNE